MKKILPNPLFLCVFALALPSLQNCVSAKPANARTSCPNDLFIEATGTGKDLDEARADAKAEIARKIISLVESQENIESRKEEDSEERISTSNIFSATSQIKSNYTLYGFKEAASRQLEDGLYEYKGYVCNSDAAKPFLDSLRIYKESLEVFRGQKLDKDICGRASEARKNMLGFQTILEVLKQPDKTLQKEYESVYVEIKKGCCLEVSKKLHWNPEKQTAYSDIAFSKLSAGIKMETSPCEGKGISLVYKNTGSKCEYAGVYKCTHKPSLLIASCQGEKYQILENENMAAYQQEEGTALEKLKEKLESETFWNEWEQELKKWRPICD